MAFLILSASVSVLDMFDFHPALPQLSHSSSIHIQKTTLLPDHLLFARPTMRSPVDLASALLLLSTLTTTKAFMVTFFKSTGCRSGAPVTLMQRPEQGCQRFEADVSKSQLITGEWSDDTFYLVFFKDDECNPDEIIQKVDANTRCTDTSGGYKSFEVWDMCETENCLG